MQKSTLGALALGAGAFFIIWAIAPFYWSVMRFIVGYQLLNYGLQLRGMPSVSSLFWILGQHMHMRR